MKFPVLKGNLLFAYIKKHPNFSGILCSDGSMGLCGYMGHSSLCADLYEMGLTEASDWVRNDSIFHISSGTLNGKLGCDLQYVDDGHRLPNITDEQFKVLLRCSHMSPYGDRSAKVGELLLKYYILKTGRGGKYGSLQFIKNVWANIKTPVLDVPGIVRSSPTKSIPGVLKSKVGTLEEVLQLNQNIWESLPEDVTKRNELHCFSQEFISGLNGVFHVRNGKFTYQCSDEQGSVVNGKAKKVKLDPNSVKFLKEIGKVFFKFFNKSVQCEFVIPHGEVEPIIVQLRLLESEPTGTVETPCPDDAILTGKSFCSYIPFGKWSSRGTCTKDQILFVEEDCENPEMLFGKKLLIVKNNVEFSHILALSKAMRIPSFYNISNKKFNLDKYSNDTTFEFDTTNERSYITIKK